jgi:hypothetical protein
VTKKEEKVRNKQLLTKPKRNKHLTKKRTFDEKIGFFCFASFFSLSFFLSFQRRFVTYFYACSHSNNIQSHIYSTLKERGRENEEGRTCEEVNFSSSGIYHLSSLFLSAF